jgi:hypothetical protein
VLARAEPGNSVRTADDQPLRRFDTDEVVRVLAGP